MANDDPSPQRIGILGGTFDPPHYGHLVIAQEAALSLALDQVWWIPSGHPPHKADEVISSAEHRVAMVELAIQGNPRFRLSRVEIDRPGPSYTVETLTDLRSSLLRTDALYLIIGGDMVADLPHWYNPAGILAAITGIAAMHRPDYGFAPGQIEALEQQLPGLARAYQPIAAPQFAISSTLLRARVAQGLPIRYLTPDPIIGYIEQYRLYQEGTP